MKCDKCNKYEVSSGGCITKCYAVHFNELTMDYFEKRESGNTDSCKCFEKIVKRYK